MSSRSENQRLVRRGQFFTLVVLQVSAQLLAALHNGMVDHATCPEHGAEVHVSRTAHMTRALLPANAGIASARVPGRLAAHGEHDHCVVGVHRRETWFGAQATAFSAPAAQQQKEASPVLVPLRQSVPLLSAAPKSSPPA